MILRNIDCISINSLKTCVVIKGIYSDSLEATKAEAIFVGTNICLSFDCKTGYIRRNKGKYVRSISLMNCGMI